MKVRKNPDKDTTYVSPKIQHIDDKKSKKKLSSGKIKYDSIKKPKELESIELDESDWVPDIYSVLKYQ